MPPIRTHIDVITADITSLPLDAIVNAANERLLGGGGVDGAIHRAAGPRLLDACRVLPEVQPGVRCPTGEARITPAFDLPSKYVIHTVGPVWHGGSHDEDRLLYDCYHNSLNLASIHWVRTIAFPAISTGVYGFPLDRAALIAVQAVSSWYSRSHPMFERIALVCFDDAARRAFASARAAVLVHCEE